MQGERNWSLELKAEEIAQRAVMLQVLRDDRDERWSRAELEREIYDIEPLEISDALERLSREGVVHLFGELVLASRAARHLDALGMFSI
jgi:hypothetical protein